MITQLLVMNYSLCHTNASLAPATEITIACLTTCGTRHLCYLSVTASCRLRVLPSGRTSLSIPAWWSTAPCCGCSQLRGRSPLGSCHSIPYDNGQRRPLLRPSDVLEDLSGQKHQTFILVDVHEVDVHAETRCLASAQWYYVC
jgi:hypothetical protein